MAAAASPSFITPISTPTSSMPGLGRLPIWIAIARTIDFRVRVRSPSLTEWVPFAARIGVAVGVGVPWLSFALAGPGVAVGVGVAAGRRADCAAGVGVAAAGALD